MDSPNWERMTFAIIGAVCGSLSGLMLSLFLLEDLSVFIIIVLAALGALIGYAAGREVFSALEFFTGWMWWI